MDSSAIAALLSTLERRGHRAATGAVRQGHRRGIGPLRSLLDAGVPITAMQTAAWALQGYELVDLAPHDLDVASMSALPLPVSRRARAVVIGRDGTVLIVATADPSDVIALDAVRDALGGPARCRVVVAEAESIDEALRRYEAREIMGPGTPDDPAGNQPLVVSLTDPGEGDSQAARTVAAIVTYAVNSKASDIHLYCTDHGADVRIRIDGVLHSYTHVPGAGAAASVIGRIKVLGGLDLGQRRLPQDGRIQVAVDGRTVDVRLATIPNVWNAEDAVLRILDPSIGVVSVESLGMGDAALTAWARLARSPYGLILVAGPTGCGKSTTLYATLREIATPDRAVRTVEDPVEVRIAGITQVQVNPRAGLTFASALRSFLRADPDVILVGEIRDHETARVATEAAVTGHLVLATVHTASASQVPVRLVEMGVPAYLVAAALRGAMAQRLVRRLCRDCKVRRSGVSPLAWPTEIAPAPAEITDAKEGGCARCAHTGYRGRLAAAEVMIVDEAIQRAIAEGVPVENMTRLAATAGMVPLRHAILDVVRSGETSLGELTRVSSAGS